MSHRGRRRCPGSMGRMGPMGPMGRGQSRVTKSASSCLSLGRGARREAGGEGRPARPLNSGRPHPSLSRWARGARRWCHGRARLPPSRILPPLRLGAWPWASRGIPGACIVQCRGVAPVPARLAAGVASSRGLAAIGPIGPIGPIRPGRPRPLGCHPRPRLSPSAPAACRPALPPPSGLGEGMAPMAPAAYAAGYLLPPLRGCSAPKATRLAVPRNRLAAGGS